MDHIFHIPDDLYFEIAAYAAQRGQTPDALIIALIREGIRLLKQEESTGPIHKASYDPAHDPLAPFIGAFDSGGDNSGWIERHDEYFAGNGSHSEHYDN